MDDPGWFDKVLPALAALAGVLVTGSVEWIKTASTRRNETKALRRTKLEELAAAVTESVGLASKIAQSANCESSEAATAPIPCRKAVALTLVYFPELRSAAERYLKASEDFSDLLLRVKDLGFAADLETAASMYFPDLHAKCTLELNTALAALDDAIAAYARKHVR